MTEVSCHSLAEGQACVISSRCPGKSRRNEDAAVLIDLGDASAVLALADGMGGGRGGHTAAKIAVESLRRSVETTLGTGQPQSNEMETPLRTAILNGFEQANQTILELGIGAATTLVAVEIHGRQLRVYHAGDSEVLLIGGQGKIKLQTESHSPVGYAIQAGLIDRQDAMFHGHRHLVSNMVGASDMRIEIGSSLTMARRDTLLLSTDGLTDNLHTFEIVELIRKGRLAPALTQLWQQVQLRMADGDSGEPSKPDDTTLVVYRSQQSN